MSVSAKPERVRVTLLDGTVREFPRGITPGEIAGQVSTELARQAIVARANGGFIDLRQPLEADCALEILAPPDPEALARAFSSLPR